MPPPEVHGRDLAEIQPPPRGARRASARGAAEAPPLPTLNPSAEGPPTPPPPPHPKAPPSPEKPDIIGAAAAFGAASLDGTPPPPSFDEASSAGVEDLVAMGFSKEAASAALALCKAH